MINNAFRNIAICRFVPNKSAIYNVAISFGTYKEFFLEFLNFLHENTYSWICGRVWLEFISEFLNLLQLKFAYQNAQFFKILEFRLFANF